MSRFDLRTRNPGRLPAPFLDVVQRLEDLGIAVWHHGETLLVDLLSMPTSDAGIDSIPATSTPRQRSPALLCAGPASSVLDALPHAVVTSSHRQRLSLGTPAGPIDLLPMGEEAIEQVLPRFGVSALSFAWRPIGERWCDPTEGRAALSRGQLDLCDDRELPTPFSVAPRRYWIAARLLAEFDLEATPRLIEAARLALSECRRRLPEGAPARREIERVLAAEDPSKGLGFLHEVGVCDALFPGMDAAGAEIAGDLDLEPSLRWAAWLAGTPTQRAMRRLRMPIQRARQIERLLRHHPIERTTAAAGDGGLRRIRQRLHPEEIEGLLRWRGHQLDRAEPNDETAANREGLERVRVQLSNLTLEQERHDRIKRLAIHGDVVMEILDRGPGPHVGRALAHLAHFVSAAPEANDRERLEAELRDWAAQNPE